MARARDPRRDEAFEIWKSSNGTIDLVEIATRLDISAGTVRGWKSKDKWEEKLNGTIGTLQSKERNATKDTERSKQPTERIDPPPLKIYEDEELTDRMKVFVGEYLRDFNATRAAIAAGYSKKSAHMVGWETLRNPKVQAAINRHKEARITELGLDVQRVIAEYMKIAFADISDLMDFGQKDEPILDEEGKPIPDPKTGDPLTYKTNYVTFRNSDEIDGTVISEVKQGRSGVSIKLHDKLRALEKLERYLDYMTEEDKLRLEKLRVDIQVAEMRVF